MDKKRLYTQADLDAYAETIKRECEQMLLRQRARIDELRVSLRAAEKKIADFEGQKDRVYRAINAALKKADDIERVSIIKYNQEIAQLKSFHNKWVSYFNKILAAYPLDEDLIAASKASGRIAEVLERICRRACRRKRKPRRRRRTILPQTDLPRDFRSRRLCIRRAILRT